jgi:2-polyprenyl-6-methoxyphenol hydroxylase-like FAD-dependent oxidoreductase
MSLRGHHRERRAVIIGGSVSGLFTAAFLRQIGGGRNERADVLVDADGIRLSVRGQFAPSGTAGLFEPLQAWRMRMVPERSKRIQWH